ncbi:MAG TPA: DNA polymerase III subunit delta' [Candidatus Hydrogenedentes bacterium]|nr:DNA polymerase III subunit delta' [Candidatus Hydrogenedentota bacterium]
MSLRGIKDQAVPIRLLQNMLKRDRVPNGLLFWGPCGVGKRMTAMEFAKAINCPEREDDACDGCLSCRKVSNGNHPDVKVVAPVKRARVIGVDTVETVNELASLRAFDSQWRVFILLEAERMHPAAQNVFLKTLEEPPGRSLFILVTEHPRMLLPTIRSRCQLMRFSSLRPETVAVILERDRGLDVELAQAIAALSQGQVSRAFDLVDTDKREVLLDIIRRLDDGEDPLALAEAFTKHLTARRDEIEALIKAEEEDMALDELSRDDREEMREQEKARIDAEYRYESMEYLYLFETWYRDAAVYGALGDASRLFNRDQTDRLAGSGQVDLAEKVAAIEKARLYLERFIKEERVFRDLFFALAGQ